LQETERITYEYEWLDNVVSEVKLIMDQLAKETFKRYRESGKAILRSGYAKYTWKSEHKQYFIEKLGISDSTFKSMVRLGEMSQEKFDNVIVEFPSLYAYENRGSITKKEKRKREIEVLKEAIKFLEPPQQLYDVVVIDPPWNYGTEYDPDTRRGACPYPEMTTEEIMNLKLYNTENCILWLWTTNAFMKDAFRILEVWGFEPKTILTWVKNNIGVGTWLRGQTEHCILAVKGNPLYDFEKAKSCSTYLVAKSNGHSEKPDEFYKLVEGLCPGWKLDYFATKQREGWATFGTMERNNK